jgi:hypothetical protein
MKTTRLGPGRFELNFAPAKGGPVEVLPKSSLVSSSDTLRAHPLFEIENIGMHKLQIALKLHERGVMHEVHRSWSRMRRTRRWVIDDLYAAVMVKR